MGHFDLILPQLHLQADTDEEVEVDIDQLSNEVLWRLDRYTKTIVQKVRKKPSQKGPDGQGSKPASTPQPNQAGSAEPFNGKEDKTGHHSLSSSSSGGESEVQRCNEWSWPFADVRNNVETSEN